MKRAMSPPPGSTSPALVKSASVACSSGSITSVMLLLLLRGDLPRSCLPSRYALARLVVLPPVEQLQAEDQPGAPGQHDRHSDGERAEPQPLVPGRVEQPPDRREVEHPRDHEHEPEDVPASLRAPEAGQEREAQEADGRDDRRQVEPPRAQLSWCHFAPRRM